MDYLVIEDDEVLARRMARALPGRACCVRTLAAAREYIDRAECEPALVVDVLLPDGCGLELVREVRQQGSSVPALVLTGTRDDTVLSAAQRLNAFFVYKPVDIGGIRSFGVFADLCETLRAQSLLRREVERMAVEHGLSRREHELLLMAARGVSRNEIARRMDIADTTVKTFIRRIVRKLRQCTLGDVVAIVHQRMFDRPFSDSNFFSLTSPVVSPLVRACASPGLPQDAAICELSLGARRRGTPGSECGAAHDLNNLVMGFMGLRDEISALILGVNASDVMCGYDELLARLVAFSHQTDRLPASSRLAPRDEL